MRDEALVDRQCGGAECLRNDLSAIQAAPWIARARADERVGAVRFEFEHELTLLAEMNFRVDSVDMAAKRGPKGMSDSHKAAMEQGRAEGRAVRDYLEALRSTKPKRGRKRTAESIAARLERIEDELATASAIDELQLLQERRDLQAEVETMDSGVDLDALEEGFVEVAKSYGERKGIAYATWRDVGVPAAALKRAGIGRGA